LTEGRGIKSVLITKLFQCLYGIGLLPFSKGKPGGGYREEGLSAPLKDRACIEEAGCTLVLLRPHMQVQSFAFLLQNCVNPVKTEKSGLEYDVDVVVIRRASLARFDSAIIADLIVRKRSGGTTGAQPSLQWGGKLTVPILQ
jgi:hypothetical protein